MGQHSVFHGFLYAVIPGLDKARSPSAAIVVFELGVAVLAGFGMDQLTSADFSPWPRRVMWTVLGYAAFTLALFQAVYFANKLSFPGGDQAAISALIMLLLAGLMMAAMRGGLNPTQAGILIAGLVLMELGNNYDGVFTPKTDTGRERWSEQMKANGDVADFLHHQPGLQRANVAASAPANAQNEAFNANWGAVHKVEMWGGSVASATSNLLNLEFHRPEARLLFGVAYTLATQPTPAAGDEVFSGRSGLKVYRNSAAFPRAWAVHKLLQARDADEVDKVMVQGFSQMRNQAVMLGKPPVPGPCDGRDWIDLLEHGADRILIRANMSCPGMVILSDTYFPGWRARVDGKAAEIYEVNGAMRGVMVPGGLHTLTMRYRPASVIWGALLTLAGILGAVGIERGQMKYERGR
jgi:Bacterial membrane protein YfhO